MSSICLDRVSLTQPFSASSVQLTCKLHYMVILNLVYLPTDSKTKVTTTFFNTKFYIMLAAVSLNVISLHKKRLTYQQT